MNTTSVTTGRVFAMWWLWMWRTIVLTFAASVALGLAAGFVGAMLGFQKEAITDTVQPAAAIVSLFINFMVFGSIFRKRFKNFRVVILPDTPTSSPEEGITMGRKFKTWWLVSWRATLLAMIAGGIIGFTFGYLQDALSFNPAYVQFGVPLLGMLAGIWISLLVFKSLFRKRFSDFRVLMVTPEAAESASPLTPPRPASQSGDKRLKPRNQNEGNDFITEHLNRKE